MEKSLAYRDSTDIGIKIKIKTETNRFAYVMRAMCQSLSYGNTDQIGRRAWNGFMEYIEKRHKCRYGRYYTSSSYSSTTSGNSSDRYDFHKMSKKKKKRNYSPSPKRRRSRSRYRKRSRSPRIQSNVTSKTRSKRS